MTLRLILFIFIFLSISTGHFYAKPVENQRKLDSLNSELKQAPDSTKIYIHQFISDIYFEEDIVDSSFYYARKAMNLSRKLNSEESIMSGYFQLGDLYFTKLKAYDTALLYFDSLYAISSRLNDTNNIGLSYLYKGLVYDNTNKFSDAINYYFKLLKLSRQADNKDFELTALVNIGNIYSMVEESDKALEHYRAAVALNKELGNKDDEALLLINMAPEYASLKQYDKAIASCKQAIKILKKLDEDYLVAFTQSNMGGIYTLMDEYDMALQAYKNSTAYLINVGEHGDIADNYAGMGNLYLEVYLDSNGKKGNRTLFPDERNECLALAIKHLEDARDKHINTNISDIYALAQVYEELTRAYETAGNITAAYGAYKEYNKLKDSLLAQEDDKKIAELEGERIIALKDKELALQDQLIKKERNERWYFIAGIVLLAIVLGGIYRNYRLRGKANKLLTDEKRKSESLLLNILPEEVAEELKEKGTADAMHFDEVTVLFTDFVNFTEASERMTSQELVNELHACFKAFDEIADKYDIEKIKTIGDAYLAVCGLPTTDKFHAEKAVNAASEILQFMFDRKAKLGNKTFDIRIGIHSGDVVAGIVGVKKFAYDIWGDTVNTAARMESKSEPGKINISQTTYKLVQDKFACTYRGELEAKNKGKLKMYFVES